MESSGSSSRSSGEEVFAAALRYCNADASLESGDALLARVFEFVPSQIGVAELVRHPGLGSLLTHEEPSLRKRATQLLAITLEHCVESGTSKMDGVRALVTFCCDRLADYPSVGPCLRALRALLEYVERHPAVYPTAAVDVAKSMFSALHIAAMEQPLRQAAFTVLLSIMCSPVHANAVLGRGPNGELLSGMHRHSSDTPFALDFAVGVVNAVDGEKDPRCLLVCLELVERVLSPQAPLCFGDAVASFTEELFDVIACYFPITFTPPPNDPHGITKDTLVKALRRALASSPRLAPYVLPLLLEKMSSSVVEAKRDAKRTLRLCAPVYGVSGLAPFLPQLASLLRSELLHSRDPLHPGASHLAASSGAAAVAQGGGRVPSLWTPDGAPGAYDSWLIGVTSGAIGLNFVGSAEAHGNSGYGLYTPQPPLEAQTARGGGGGAAAAALTALVRLPALGAGAKGRDAGSAAGKNKPPSSPGSPPAGEGSLALDALAAIADITALLSQGAVDPAGDLAPWHAFVTPLITACVADVERAADSLDGRACARILCAVASASHHALATVLESVVPVAGELYEETTLTGGPRFGVRSSVLGLIAGLLHTIDHGIDHPLGGHPFSKHCTRVYDMLFDALTGGSPSTGGHRIRRSNSEAQPPRVHGSVASRSLSGSAAEAAAHAASAAGGANGGGNYGGGDDVDEEGDGGAGSEEARMQVAISRCIAAAGLCDLAVRPPSSLLAPRQKLQVTESFTTVCLSGGNDAVREACLRALCTMASVRTKFCAAVVAVSVPRMMAVVRRAIRDEGQAADAAAHDAAASAGGLRGAAQAPLSAAGRAASIQPTGLPPRPHAPPSSPPEGSWTFAAVGQEELDARDTLARALYSLGQLCCISSSAVQHTIVPQLLEVAVEVTPPSAEGAAPLSRGSYRLRSPCAGIGLDCEEHAANPRHQLTALATLSVVETLARMVATKALARDAASMDAFLLPCSGGSEAWREFRAAAEGRGGSLLPSTEAGAVGLRGTGPAAPAAAAIITANAQEDGAARAWSDAPLLLVPTLFNLLVDSVAPAAPQCASASQALPLGSAPNTHADASYGGMAALPHPVRSAIELVFRTVSMCASAPVQDAFREAVTRVLLGDPAPGHAAATPLLPVPPTLGTPLGGVSAGAGAAAGGMPSPLGAGAAGPAPPAPSPPCSIGLEAPPWFQPLSLDAPMQQRRVLPALLKVLCCTRRGAPVSEFARIIPALAASVFTVPCGDLLSAEDPQQRHRLRTMLELAVASTSGLGDLADLEESISAAAAAQSAAAPPLPGFILLPPRPSSPVVRLRLELQRAAVLCAQAVGMLFNRAPLAQKAGRGSGLLSGSSAGGSPFAGLPVASPFSTSSSEASLQQMQSRDEHALVLSLLLRLVSSYSGVGGLALQGINIIATSTPSVGEATPSDPLLLQQLLQQSRRPGPSSGTTEEAAADSCVDCTVVATRAGEGSGSAPAPPPPSSTTTLPPAPSLGLSINPPRQPSAPYWSATLRTAAIMTSAMRADAQLERLAYQEDGMLPAAERAEGAALPLLTSPPDTPTPHFFATSSAPPVVISRARERGVLLLVWLTKGLAMRSHPTARRCIAALVNVATGRDVEGAGRVPVSQHLVTFAGQGLGIVVADAPSRHPFDREAGASVTGVYKQKMFTEVYDLYSQLHDAASASHLSTPDTIDDVSDYSPVADGVSSPFEAGGTPLAGSVKHLAPPAPGGSLAQDGPVEGAAPSSPAAPLRIDAPASIPVSASARAAGVQGGLRTPELTRLRHQLTAGSNSPGAPGQGGTGDLELPAGHSPNAQSGATVVTRVRANAEPEAMVPLLLSLCAMAMHLPVAVLLNDTDRVLPLVIRALEISSLGGSLYTGPSARPGRWQQHGSRGGGSRGGRGAASVVSASVAASQQQPMVPAQQQPRSPAAAARDSSSSNSTSDSLHESNPSSLDESGEQPQSGDAVVPGAASTAAPSSALVTAAAASAARTSAASSGGPHHSQGSTHPHPQSSPPPANGQLLELRDAVTTSALFCLRILIAHASSSVASHLHTLVPVLVTLACHDSFRPVKALVRATAIDCLRGFVTFPFNRLYPVRSSVMNGLVSALDDPKRAVRRRAAACRNDWATLGEKGAGGAGQQRGPGEVSSGRRAAMNAVSGGGGGGVGGGAYD